MFEMLQKDHLRNPLIPRSNCQIISLYNITSESDSKVMRIKEVVPDLKEALVVWQILLNSITENVQR